MREHERANNRVNLTVRPVTRLARPSAFAGCRIASKARARHGPQVTRSVMQTTAATRQ